MSKIYFCQTKQKLDWCFGYKWVQQQHYINSLLITLGHSS